MSTKTTFCYAFVAILAVIGSAMAVPLTTVDAPAAIESGNDKLSTIPPAVDLQEQSSDSPTTANFGPTEQEPKSEAVTEESEPSVSETDPDSLTVPNEKTADSPPSTVVQKVDDVVVLNLSSSDAVPNLSESSAGLVPPAPAPVSNTPSSDNESNLPSAGSNIPIPDQRPPYLSGGVQTVKIGPSIPFFMEFFQPFEVFPQFNRRQPPPQQHQQFPFGASIDPFSPSVEPFDPFVNPMRSPSFNQLVNAYTNEFRTPEVIIVKPKRQVKLNTTSIPPIPLLMNIMLNAFRHEPSDMLASLDKGFPKLESVDTVKESPDDKPVTKTTSKTEIIDGQVVQINETTVKNGHGNHQSFYHFKEIKVLPQVPNVKKIANEEKTSVSTDNSETEKVETNEIKQGPSDDVISVAIPSDDRRENFVRKPNEPVSLEDHFQTAAATYYAPYSPYGSWQSPSSASLHLSRPPPHAVSLNYNQPPPMVASMNYNRPQPMVASMNYNQPPPMVESMNYNGPPPAMASMNFYNRPPSPALVPNNYYNRPPVNGSPAPISLHGDTFVNELVAAQQQASGVSATLPPDVELLDTSGKPQKTQGGQFYYNNHHTGPQKYPGGKY